MWPNRKTRLILVMSLFIVANLVLWLLYLVLGDHDFLDYLILVDVFTVLMFAAVGILLAWCFAFRPEALARSIERGIAGRKGNGAEGNEDVAKAAPNAHRLGRSFVTIAVWATIVLAAVILFLMSKRS